MIILNSYRFDPYKKLLLHMNGADESPTFIDSSLSAHTITANGHAQLDTAQKKFGTASGLFDGTGDYLSIPNSGDFDFGTDDFTVDCQVRIASIDAAYNTVIFHRYIDDNNWTAIQYNHTNNLLQFVQRVTGTYVFVGSTTSTWTPTLDQWYHLAFVRKGTASINDWMIFVDGVSKAMTIELGSVNQSFQTAADLDIGFKDIDSKYINGHVDEYRISKGIARETANFTPPTKAYN